MQLQRTTKHTPGAQLAPKWHVIDARGQRLGRLASDVARVLQGKHSPNYSAHALTGDFVVVINAADVGISGNKLTQKIYYRHTGYVGHLRKRTLGEMMTRFPERVIERAVKGMLPRNRLARRMLRRLKVYATDTHPHEAQVRAGTGARAAATAAKAAAAALAPPSRRPKRTEATAPKAQVVETQVEEQAVAVTETPAPTKRSRTAKTETAAPKQAADAQATGEQAAKPKRTRAETKKAAPAAKADAKPAAKPARKPRSSASSSTSAAGTTRRKRTPPKDQE